MKVLIEIEVPDRINVWDDENIHTEEEAFDKFGVESVVEFQTEMANKVKMDLKSKITDFKEDFLEEICSTVCVPDWDSFEDFDIKFSCVEQKEQPLIDFKSDPLATRESIDQLIDRATLFQTNPYNNADFEGFVDKEVLIKSLGGKK